eukprot:Tamp_28047.p1 GENE.Tamp_28047~~Tamp_28047.p1  ORF type:complete len:107 (+),score=0.65 Tamp_28047:354-674(+)
MYITTHIRTHIHTLSPRSGPGARDVCSLVRGLAASRWLEPRAGHHETTASRCDAASTLKFKFAPRERAHVYFLDFLEVEERIRLRACTSRSVDYALAHTHTCTGVC